MLLLLFLCMYVSEAAISLPTTAVILENSRVEVPFPNSVLWLVFILKTIISIKALFYFFLFPPMRVR